MRPRSRPRDVLRRRERPDSDPTPQGERHPEAETRVPRERSQAGHDAGLVEKARLESRQYSQSLTVPVGHDTTTAIEEGCKLGYTLPTTRLDEVEFQRLHSIPILRWEGCSQDANFCFGFIERFQVVDILAFDCGCQVNAQVEFSFTAPDERPYTRFDYSSCHTATTSDNLPDWGRLHQC